MGNKRTARGAYEEAGAESAGGYASGGRTGRRLEDDAWDTRVGNEDPYGDRSDRAGYSGYEEQELGLAPTPGLNNESYGGGRAGAGGGGDYLGASGYNERGRSRGGGGSDPFGDQNEAPSLRSVSPRPHEGGHTKGNESLDTNDGNTSPISTRKSVFREGI